MSVEPYALMKAGHVCREQLPETAHLYFTLDGDTLTKISHISQKSSERIKIIYYIDGKKHQITVDLSCPIIVSMEALTTTRVADIICHARMASSPFREFGKNKYQRVLPNYDTSALTSLQGMNHFG